MKILSLKETQMFVTSALKSVLVNSLIFLKHFGLLDETKGWVKYFNDKSNKNDKTLNLDFV